MPDGKPPASTLDPLFRPRSVAVIGASRTPHTVGNTILWNLVQHGFSGAVYPVNPNATAIHSIRCFPDVQSIPDPVDLAVVAVPGARVMDVARACAKKGVRGLC